MSPLKLTKTYEPYPKYKKSEIKWIGQIPNGWSIRKIRHSTYLKARVGWQNLRSEEFGTEGVLCITGTDFKNGLVDIKNAYRVGKDRYDQDHYIQLRENDLLITKDGTIGKIALVKHLNEPATLNSGIFVTRPQNNVYSQRFMFWVLNSRIFEEFVSDQSLGSTINHLYQNVFVNFTYPFPEKSEQDKISLYIDRKVALIDQIIEKKQKLIDLLQEKRSALITHAVTKGLDPKAKMKPSGIDWLKEVPEGWTKNPLKYLFAYQSGGVWGEEATGNEDDLVCVRVADYDFVEFIAHSKNFTVRNVPRIKKELILDEYSILLEKSGGGDQQPVGRAVRYLEKDRATCSNFIQKLQVKRKYNPEYIIYLLTALYLEGVTNKVIKKTTGIQNLDLASFLRTDVYLPTISEQVSLVTYIKAKSYDIINLIKMINKQVEYLSEYRSSLIYHAVTGKIKI